MKKPAYIKIVVILILLVCCGIVAVVGLIGFSKYTIHKASNERIFDSLEKIPDRKVALVLGCSPYLANGRMNLYFKYRMQAALELYRAGKIQFILVSGDNSRSDYDESSSMKTYLIEHGVPDAAIVPDFAGFSTLDSVVRAKEVFQQEHLVVVSQDFHVRRAIYIGEQYGIDLIGYAARDVSGRGGFRTRMREHLARVKAVLDVHLFSRSPKYLGEPVPIG